MKIYIVVMDVINDVTYYRNSVNTCVVITLLLHDIIHWKSVTSYDKLCVVVYCPSKKTYEPGHEKTNNLHVRNKRRRSASQ